MTITNKSKGLTFQVLTPADLAPVLSLPPGGRTEHKKPFKTLKYVELFWNTILHYEHLSVYTVTQLYFKFLNSLGFTKYGSTRSMDYWVTRGYTEEEALCEIKNIQSSYSNRHTKTSRKSPRQIKFWTNKGLTEEEAKKEVGKIQGRGKTFYKNKGLTEGEIEKKIQLRNERWVASLAETLKHDNFNKRKGKTFSQLVERHGEEKAEKIIRNRLCNFSGQSNIEKAIFEKYFQPNGFKRSFYLMNPETTRPLIYDYYHSESKVLIEFNGDFWHCNPTQFTEDYFHPIIQKTAKEIWAKDERKKTLAAQHGFELAVLWESGSIEEQLKQLCKNSTTLKLLLENSLNLLE